MITVTLPYNHHSEDDKGPLKWAKDHCPSYITNTVVTGFVIKYYFSQEADAVLFALRWAY